MTSPATEADNSDGRQGAQAAPADPSAPPPANDAGAANAEETSAQDWAEAENSRPTLPDETADGLDDMDEEVRHQAEDLPLDTPGRL